MTSSTLTADDNVSPEPAEPTLWVTDAELIRRSGVPEKIARVTIQALDKNPASGFPKKNPQWGDRRYYPAVKAFWERTANARNNPQTPRPAGPDSRYNRDARHLADAGH